MMICLINEKHMSLRREYHLLLVQMCSVEITSILYYILLLITEKNYLDVNQKCYQKKTIQIPEMNKKMHV